MMMMMMMMMKVTTTTTMMKNTANAGVYNDEKEHEIIFDEEDDPDEGRIQTFLDNDEQEQEDEEQEAIPDLIHDDDYQRQQQEQGQEWDFENDPMMQLEGDDDPIVETVDEDVDEEDEPPAVTTRSGRVSKPPTRYEPTLDAGQKYPAIEVEHNLMTQAVLEENCFEYDEVEAAIVALIMDLSLIHI